MSNESSHDYSVKLSTNQLTGIAKPGERSFDAGQGKYQCVTEDKRKATVVAVPCSERKGKNLIRNATNKSTV